jgi:hypothetical protein
MLHKHTPFYYILTRMKTCRQVCCFMTIRCSREKLSVTLSGFCHVFLYNYLYIEFVLVIIHHDNGHRNDRNMLVKNNNKICD